MHSINYQETQRTNTMAAKRNYREEEARQGPERKRARAARNRARYKVFKKLKEKHGATKAKQMMEGKDVDHVKDIASGGSNSESNLRLRDASDNRADKSMFKGKRTTRPEAKKKKK